MRWNELSASSGRRRGQQQPGAGEIGLHRRERLVQLVADRRRHLAERRQLRRLLEALLGLLEVPLHPLARGDLRAESRRFSTRSSSDSRWMRRLSARVRRDSR